MNLSGLLNDTVLNQDTVGQISQQLGEDPSTTQNAIQAALPMLLGGLANNAADEQGAASLQGALQQHDGSILDNLGGYLNNYSAGPGAGILGHIFGGAQPVAEERVSQASGMDMSKVGPLLMMLAPIVLGAIGRSQQQSGGGFGNLAGILGGATRQTAQQSPLMGVLGSVLDRNHDGSSMDDIAGMIGGLLGGRR